MDFFAQLEALKLMTPRTGGIILTSENSTFNHNIEDCKNCYLLANAVKNQDCMYGRDFYHCTDCVDCAHVLKCTLCYECVNCANCYDSTALQDCENCQNCDFGYDVKGCNYCIGCVGLRKKEFHIFNQPYSKEEFFEKKKTLTTAIIEQEFEKLKTKVPREFAKLIQTENCTGDGIHQSRNVYSSFDVVDCQDCTYLIETKGIRDCHDISILEYSELCYDISSSHNLNNCSFCFSCAYLTDSEYCEWVMNSKNCFGCVSLNHKEYHILNQPYSKENYFKKVAEIKEQLKRDGTYGRRYLSPTYPHEDTVASWSRM